MKIFEFNIKRILSFFLIIAAMFGCKQRGDKSMPESGSPDAIIQKVVKHFLEMHNNFSTEKDVWGGYTMDLAFEAMLFYDLHTSKNVYTGTVLDIMKLRNRKPSDTVSYRSQPFCSYNYALNRATGNEDYVNSYVSETIKMIKEVKRTSEGAIQLHHKDKTREGDYVLIDYVQDENGMWHQLLHLPFDKSYPETSGTGMIAYNLAVAYKKEFLKDEKYRDAALLAANGLKKYVTDDGVVLGTCKGPGPLISIANYLNNPAEPDDHHGTQAVIYGMLAEIILRQPSTGPDVN